MNKLPLLVAVIAVMGVLPAVAVEPGSIHPAKGLSGIQEVQVDAGDGKVLSVKH